MDIAYLVLGLSCISFLDVESASAPAACSARKMLALQSSCSATSFAPTSKSNRCIAASRWFFAASAAVAVFLVLACLANI